MYDARMNSRFTLIKQKRFVLAADLNLSVRQPDRVPVQHVLLLLCDGGHRLRRARGDDNGVLCCLPFLWGRFDFRRQKLTLWDSNLGRWD